MSTSVHAAAAPARPAAAPPARIEIIDENLKYGFAQLPRPVLRAKGLSPKAKLVYTMLLAYAWQSDSCFPGQERLASDLDISIDSVQRGLSELRAYQLIDWKQQGLNKPNIYSILKVSESPRLQEKIQEKISGKPQIAASKNRKQRLQETANCGTNYTKSNNTKQKNTQSNTRSATAQTSKGRLLSPTPACSHIAPGTIGNTNERREGHLSAAPSGTPPLPPQEHTEPENQNAIENNPREEAPAPAPTDYHNFAKVNHVIPGSHREELKRLYGSAEPPARPKQQPTRHTRQPVYIGKPLTQEELDERSREGRRRREQLTSIGALLQQNQQPGAATTPPAPPPLPTLRDRAAAAPGYLQEIIHQYSFVFNDQEHTQSNITQAVNLAEKTGATEETMRAALYKAYSLTRKSDRITARNETNGQISKMRYFFRVLADKLDIQEAKTSS